MIVISKTGKKLNFLETGVEGIYILDRIAFKNKFDENNYNDWDNSTGKKKLQEWTEKKLPDEILKQFDVDLLTIEEAFSQKELSGIYLSGRELNSKQLPIFYDTDNRMMKFDGKPTWWWTRSAAYIGFTFIDMFCVSIVGGVDLRYGDNKGGFVPVLRKKR